MANKFVTNFSTCTTFSPFCLFTKVIVKIFKGNFLWLYRKRNHIFLRKQKVAGLLYSTENVVKNYYFVLDYKRGMLRQRQLMCF